MIQEPTQKQINNCILAGWEYLGDGLFAKDDVLGYFTKEGFKKS
jgi:hypothetical protein